MKVYCNICDKEVKPIDNKCPYCGLDFDEIVNEDIQEDNTINAIARILKNTALIILGLGLILGLVLAGRDDSENFIMILLTIWISFGSIGLFTYALGEIIQILHDIRLKIYQK